MGNDGETIEKLWGKYWGTYGESIWVPMEHIWKSWEQVVRHGNIRGTYRNIWGTKT